MTADEFMATVGGETYVDLVEGVVETQPMPHRLHGIICTNVILALGNFVRKHDLGRVMSNDTHVRIRRDPDTLRGADVLFVSYDRLPRGPVGHGVVDPPPELIVEVRSPSATWAAQLRKATDYLEAGVIVVLLLDPDVRSVWVFRLNAVPQTLQADDFLTVPDVLPGFSVPVKSLFE
jgi:Uma2 family endonuclease